MRKTVLKKEPRLLSKLKAFQYQEEAYNAIKDLKYSAIFHEQGLGKTKIAIDTLLYWLDKKGVDCVIIVTKKQLVQNWINEFLFHTHIRPAILNSNKKDNYYVFNGPYRVIVTNFEVVTVEKERFKLFLKARNSAIIIDESTKLKNPESKLTQTFFELAQHFVFKCIMTGTPIANRPYDIWAQIFFLDQGESLGKDFNSFKKSCDLSNKLYQSDCKRKLFEGSINKISEKINKFSVRETKNHGIIDLPDKKYITIIAKFESSQQRIYESIKRDLTILIQKGDTTLLDDSSSSLKRLLRLVQATSNPKLIDNMYYETSGKEFELDTLIKKIIDNNEKCIVWSNFIENIDYFTKKYSMYDAVKIHGKMSIQDRNKSIEKFKKDECKILFATPQSAKEGLTLTMANHVIFYDRGFSLDDYLQAQDRIHRISQKKTCYIYNIMIENSIDLWVDVLLKAKQNAAFLAQGDITLDKYQNISDYSFGKLVKEILDMEEDCRDE